MVGGFIMSRHSHRFGISQTLLLRDTPLKMMMLTTLLAVLLAVPCGICNVAYGEEACVTLLNTNNGDVCQCTRPPPELPPRPQFCSTSISTTPELLTSTLRMTSVDALSTTLQPLSSISLGQGTTSLDYGTDQTTNDEQGSTVTSSEAGTDQSTIQEQSSTVTSSKPGTDQSTTEEQGSTVTSTSSKPGTDQSTTEEQGSTVTSSEPGTDQTTTKEQGSTVTSLKPGKHQTTTDTLGHTVTSTSSEPSTDQSTTEERGSTVTSSEPGTDQGTTKEQGSTVTSTSSKPGTDQSTTEEQGSTTTSLEPGTDQTTTEEQGSTVTSLKPGKDQTTTDAHGQTFTSTSSEPGSDQNTTEGQGSTVTSSGPGPDKTTTEEQGSTVTSLKPGKDQTTTDAHGQTVTSTSSKPGSDQSTTEEQGSTVTSSEPGTDQSTTKEQGSTVNSTSSKPDIDQSTTEEQGPTVTSLEPGPDKTTTEEQDSTVTSSEPGTEQSHLCSLPDGIAAKTECVGTVTSGTHCTFNCPRIANTSIFVCNDTNWSPFVPTCGALQTYVSLDMENATRRKRRNDLSGDNPSVIAIEDMLESALISIPTVYLASVTTFSAQNLSNGHIDGIFINDVMYSSDVTLTTLIGDVKEAILAIDEVTNVTVSDVQAICSPSICKNNGACTVDIDRLDYFCNCPKQYSGNQCEISQDFGYLSAILIPGLMFIIAMFVMTVFVIVWYRTTNRHRYEKGVADHDQDLGLDERWRRRQSDNQQLHSSNVTKGMDNTDNPTRTHLSIDLSKRINSRMRERTDEYKSGVYSNPIYKDYHSHGHDRNDPNASERHTGYTNDWHRVGGELARHQIEESQTSNVVCNAKTNNNLNDNVCPVRNAVRSNSEFANGDLNRVHSVKLRTDSPVYGAPPHSDANATERIGNLYGDNFEETRL